MTTSADSMAVPPSPRPSGTASGLAFGVGAYTLWGLFPIFWPLLGPAGSVEILAHRIAWTMVFLLGGLLLFGRWAQLRGLSARSWWLVSAAAVLIAINWGTYIYGVTSGQVTETALGYFINPLVSVVLGVAVLNERLRPAQWTAVVVAAVAVVVLTMKSASVPVIALVLATSFGVYGLIKKTVPMDSATSLTAESVVLGPIAAGYLIWLGVAGTGTFGQHGFWHAVLLISAGPVTIVPLLMFGASAQRLRLVTLGALQYLAPILQFAWGLFVLHEPMPPERWLGFGLVWAALALFTVDGALAAHRSRRRIARYESTVVPEAVVIEVPEETAQTK
ncbi:EamA family transporter RarD [Allokutzneria albata]|uniref:Chloramphenicol-sensitive protein RarD n=1 Tax=Allokutzneria albata TaxID=211114 RepID=A0A1G9Z1M0_ALLAB|nr:EamA family transporter RarD [Allokutzneria albata]SDN15312.1 chloramphenicol-sensitive protein RarD [Allokutzneria albata]